MPDEGPPALVRAREIAERIAVHPATIWRWAAAGVVPSIRVGRTVRFDPDAVKAALEAQSK